MDLPPDERNRDVGPSRVDSLGRRLRDWLTPSRALQRPEPRLQLLDGVQLNVFRIDASTRQLLDPGCSGYAYQILRERGFPNCALSLDASDLQLLDDGCGLSLSALGSVRWLAASDRPVATASFAFLYQPFTIALNGDCLISGRIVPAASRAALPCATLRPWVQSQRVHLRGIAATATSVPATATATEQPGLAEVLYSLRRMR